MKRINLARPIFICLFLLFLVHPVAAQEPTPEPVMGRVVGQVENLTAGAEAPVDRPVILYALQDFEPVDVFSSTLSSTGGFVFEDVPLLKGQTYIATLEYQSVSYGSSFVTFDGIGFELQLDIETYETSSDPTAIRVSRMHVIVDFRGENMQVSELYIFDNLTDRVYVGPTGNLSGGTLELPLLEGAVSPTVERGMGDSMVPTSNSVVLVSGGFLDTLAVRPGPGAQQLMLTYELPYQNQALVSHPLIYPVQSVSLFLPDIGLTVESDVLADSEGRSMQGMPFAQWDAADLPAGEQLSFLVSGELDMASMMELTMEESTGVSAASSSALTVQAGDNTTSWRIGLGFLVFSLLLVAFLWTRHQEPAEDSPREELLWAIIELDAAHEAGEISKARYELEREQIKGELRAWYGE